MLMSDYPEGLKYSEEHEWVRANEGRTVRIGITSYAAEALGDIVYVSLPTVGEVVSKGDACGELESTKSVSDIYSPVSGMIVGINEGLLDLPETLNQDSYSDGWLYEVELSDPSDLDALMDNEAYAAHVGE